MTGSKPAGRLQASTFRESPTTNSVPTGLPFAALAADLDGQIDDDFQRVQGDAGFQLPQVAAGRAG